jgi:hypothetical protein
VRRRARGVRARDDRARDAAPARRREDAAAAGAALLKLAGLALALLASPLAAPQDAPPLPPTWRLLQSLAEAKGFRAEFDAVPAHLATMVKGAGAGFGRSLLSRVARGLSQPWSVPELARELRDGLASPLEGRSSGGVAAQLDLAARWLDLDLAAPLAGDARFGKLDQLWLEIAATEAATAPAAAPAAPPIVEQELLEKLSDFVGLAHESLAELAPALDDERRSLLRAGFPGWCETWFRCHSPKPQVSQEQDAQFQKYDALTRKVDRARLLAVATRVARLADPAFLATLGKRLARTPRGAKVEGFAGDVVASAGDRDGNRVVLLGAGKSVVSGRAALVIDLGGDDKWARAAVADDPELLVSVVLELGGDDAYESEAPGPAYAAGAIALLVDAKGKDHYASKRLGQAASSLGVAVLADLEGNDRYEAADFAQGFSFCGVSLLVDKGGDDDYRAWAVAQGGGVGNGFCALVDGGGDDRYLADGHWPDVYGDSGPDSFHGASQGYSTGIRGDADASAEVEVAGGIAALLDLGGGKDFYQSGNFSQGGGYYFAFGLMFDGGGDDENHGYRYSQGFGVHQACGMRWDAGGNDKYVARCAANCGAGWDEGVGWLLDEAGDDTYEVGGLALGGTANTAVAVLVDGGGDDVYGGGGGADAQGGSSDSSYHKFQAIGALIDLGGGKDRYSRPDRGDDRALTGDWYGLFLDAKEKDPAKLLDAKVLQKLLAPPPKPKVKPEKGKGAAK